MVPTPPLVFVKQLQLPDDTRHQHARAQRRGSELRLAKGVYVDAAGWRAMDARSQYLLRIRAVAESRRNRPVLSHQSAAAVHGLALLGENVGTVHVTQPPTSTSRSRPGLTRHSLSLSEDDVVEVEGLLVTSVARTVLDLATFSSFRSAVVSLDSALHRDPFDRTPPLVNRDALITLWESLLPFRGHARCRAAIEFGEEGADTPLESISRVSMREIGAPRPLLQSAFFDERGFIARTDFDWPEFGVIGEADGENKYLDSAKRSGRSPEQVMLYEKYREDRLRALPKSIARWNWSEAMDHSILRRKLERAGLTMGHRW